MEISELRGLALALAPELAASPLYVIEQPKDYPSPPLVLAWSCGRADFTLRRQLIAAGEWLGQGSLIVFARPLELVEDRLGALLHEVAHRLPATPPVDDREPEPGEAEREYAVIRDWAALDDSLSARSALPRWYPSHGISFIRRALHLHHRAARLGHDELPFPALRAAGFNYELSPLVAYSRALGDEPQRLLDASFDQISTHPLPDQFVSLWLQDVIVWQRGQDIA